MARDVGEIVGFARDQNDDRELAAKNRHLAVFDITGVARNKFGNALHQSDLVRPNCRENQMIFVRHGGSVENWFK
jgi:hypothetical protein